MTHPSKENQMLQSRKPAEEHVMLRTEGHAISNTVHISGNVMTINKSSSARRTKHPCTYVEIRYLSCS